MVSATLTRAVSWVNSFHQRTTYRWRKFLWLPEKKVWECGNVLWKCGKFFLGVWEIFVEVWENFVGSLFLG